LRLESAVAMEMGENFGGSDMGCWMKMFVLVYGCVVCYPN